MLKCPRPNRLCLRCMAFHSAFPRLPETIFIRITNSIASLPRGKEKTINSVFLKKRSSSSSEPRGTGGVYRCFFFPGGGGTGDQIHRGFATELCPHFVLRQGLTKSLNFSSLDLKLESSCLSSPSSPKSWDYVQLPSTVLFFVCLRQSLIMLFRLAVNS